MAWEEWRSIFGGRYDVSNLGRVRRIIPGEPDGRIMHQKVDEHGYCLVSIARKMGDVTRWQRVHRLVADAFLVQSDGKFFVNHLNANRQDNRVENLAWCTAKENMEHAIVLGTISRGSERPRTHLQDEDVIAIRTRRARGESLSVLASDYTLSLVAMSAMVRGVTWKHLPGALGKKRTPSASKLTVEQVQAIRQAHQDGAKQKDLALQFGINNGTVSMIVNYRIWRDID